MTGPDGILVVDKTIGPTSHDVVAVARRALRTSRVGHTGTLDPLASGVLVLVVGRATRLARFMTHDRKRYEARIAFGRATDTHDAAGAVTVDTGRTPTRTALEHELAGRVGAQLQTPPAFSAKKVDGRVAHKAARAQTPLALTPVPVTVHTLSLLTYDEGVATVDLQVSAGFYVRSLAHDLGVALETGAHLGGLRRTEAGPFTLADAVGLDVLATDRDASRQAVIGLERVLPHLPAAHLDARDALRIRHGQTVAVPPDLANAAPGAVRLLGPNGALIAVAEPRPGAPPVLQPVVVVG